MKLTKSQLNTLVRQAIRKSLNETMRFPKNSTKVNDQNDVGMSKNDLSAHLSAEREKKQRKDVQQRRASMRNTSRGMELESGCELTEDQHEGREDYLKKLRSAGWDDTEILEELVLAMSNSEATENFKYILDKWEHNGEEPEREELVGKEVPAADGSDYGFRILNFLPDTDDYTGQIITWSTGVPSEQTTREIDAFKLSYRYIPGKARKSRV